MSDIQIRVITCNDQSKRMKHFNHLWHEANKKSSSRYNVLQCVNGKKFKKKDLVHLVESKQLDPHTDMDIIEVAIYMSHLKCWEEFLKTDYKYLIVMEDDVEIRPYFEQGLKRVLKALDTLKRSEWNGVLYLFHGNYISYKQEPFRTVQNRKPKITFNRIIPKSTKTMLPIPTGSAYLLTRDMAKKWVKDFYPMSKPVDVIMANYYKKALTLNMKGDHFGPHGRSSPLIYLPQYTDDQSSRSEVPYVDEML